MKDVFENVLCAVTPFVTPRAGESASAHSSVKEPFSPGRAAAGGRPSLAPGEEWLLRISPPQNGGIGGSMAL